MNLKGYDIVQRTIILLLLLISFSVLADPRLRPADWAVPVIGSSLDNLYKVGDGLYRSEQPNDAAFREVSKFGVGEVLNLREYHSDDDEAEGAGLILHRIKIDTGAISQDQLFEALAIVINRKSPMLVHCWHGSDRTGAVIAAYRVVVENWTKEKAIDELVAGGYGYHDSIYPNIVTLIQELDVEKMRQELGLNT